MGVYSKVFSNKYHIKLPFQTPGTEKKRYGIDSKNATYKPAGGNVKIFEKKLDVKSVGARVDNKPSPKKADGSPRIRRYIKMIITPSYMPAGKMKVEFLENPSSTLL